MKPGIHPAYNPATITCACGEVIHTQSTVPGLRVEICSKCHPLFTGRQKLIDSEGRVLLVRHGYRPGWWFPGGGVEWGETLLAALARELEEEVGVTITSAPELHGIFSNFANFPGDHIAVFVVRHWQRRQDYWKRGEIAEANMFAWNDLPETVNPGTRARIAEIFANAPVASRW